VREDRVTQRSLSLWAQNETRWTDVVPLGQPACVPMPTISRSTANLPQNSGKASDQMVTPKLALIFGPWRKTEFYLNYGQGFHSNDARGTTIRSIPATAHAGGPGQAAGPHDRLRARPAQESRFLAGDRSASGNSNRILSCCSSVTPERPRRRVRRAATASNGTICIYRRPTGWPSMPTSPGRTRAFRDSAPGGQLHSGRGESHGQRRHHDRPARTLVRRLRCATSARGR
jgi:hypothetical protein